MIIAVDFDGTIVEHQYPKIGKIKLFAFETLKQLRKDGHKIILWTYRSGELLHEAVEFCLKNGVEFYAVNSSYQGEEIDKMEKSRKIAADMFIDDRNFGGFPGWSNIWQALGESSECLKSVKREKEIKNDNPLRRFVRFFGFGISDSQVDY